jgi:hypothetical protein
MLKGVFKIQILKLETDIKTTHVMCNPWKRIFTLAPLALLTMFSLFKGKHSSSTHCYHLNVEVCFDYLLGPCKKGVEWGAYINANEFGFITFIFYVVGHVHNCFHFIKFQPIF